MTLPANIRVNVGAPFPALVKATAGIALGRANGIWTLGLAYSQFGIQAPPPATNYPTDYVLIWDAVAQTYFRVPLTSLGIGGERSQRSVTAGPVTIQANDQILHCNIGSPQTVHLPPAITRNGVPLLFKDVGMQAAANNITVVPASGETIDGFSSVALVQNGQALQVTPANDGVNTGWFRE
jgi:hypothetical protein